MKEPTKMTGAGNGALPSKEERDPLAIAREVIVRRKEALGTLAQLDIAEQIMTEDHEILRARSKN